MRQCAKKNAMTYQWFYCLLLLSGITMRLVYRKLVSKLISPEIRIVMQVCTQEVFFQAYVTTYRISTKVGWKDFKVFFREKKLRPSAVLSNVLIDLENNASGFCNVSQLLSGCHQSAWNPSTMWQKSEKDCCCKGMLSLMIDNWSQKIAAASFSWFKNSSLRKMKITIFRKKSPVIRADDHLSPL